MRDHHTMAQPSKAALWTGRILSALPVLMLLMSAGMKFAKPPPVLEGLTHLGLGENLLIGLGILELTCTLIYLIPATAVLGAILLTGYLGGAILAHLRVGDAYLSPGILGILLWGGLYLRDMRLRALIPFRSPIASERPEAPLTEVETIRSEAKL